MSDRRRLLVGTTMGVLALLAAGCDPAPGEAADGPIGRWTVAEPGTSGAVEFGPDGRFALTDQDGGTVTGTWTASEPGALDVIVTGSDILRDRIEPVEPERFVVRTRTEGELLHLSVGDETTVYRRASDVE